MQTFPERPSHAPRAKRYCIRALLLATAMTLGGACSDEDTPFPAEQNGTGGGAGSSGMQSGGAQGQPPWRPPPALRNPAIQGDEELARQALALLGSDAVGGEGRCRTCHSLGRPTLTNWSRLTQEFAAACLDEVALDGRSEVEAMLGCFRARAGSRAFAPASFGIYAAAAHLPWFSFVFEQAGNASGDWRADYERFVARVGMPRSGSPLTQAQFDVVAEWFARGLPELYELVPEDSGEACTPGLDPRVSAHVAAMRLDGWRAKNEEVPLLMFGCNAGQVGAGCLSEFPLAENEAYGAAWGVLPGARIVLLYDNSARHTTFWSRASADGRFIGSGLVDQNAAGFYGQILDLEREAIIPVNFSYDATFFPDNSGFLVQQGGGVSSAPPGGGATDGSADSGDVAVVCQQSVLGGDPDQISGEEPECVSLDSEFGLYQQLAKSLDGDDYWVIHGSYQSDDGGFRPVLANPSAAFATENLATLTPMINQGGRFEAGTPTRVQTPLQGDPMLSPSGRLVVTRLKGQEYMIRVDGYQVVDAEQSGYALHTITTEQTSAQQSGGEWSASLADVGRICLTGGKATFSYDERWMVLHHYVTLADASELGLTESDPGFLDYLELGAANLYLVDLLDGSSHRITNMLAGQYALFPHFRSDGWIYFVVRTVQGDEYFAASDAALVLESGGQ